MNEVVSDILLQRIDRLTGQLNPAVAQKGGAEFALMLSMIYQAQQLASSQAVAAGGGAAADARLGLYSPALVGRMGEALQAGQRGELALLVSWVEEAPVRRPAARVDATEAALPTLARSAVLGKSYSLVDEIRQSLSVAA